MAASSTIQERIKKTGLDVIHPPSGLQVLAAIVMSWSSPKTSFPTVLAAVPVHWDTLLGDSKAKAAKSMPFFFGEFQQYALKGGQVDNDKRRVGKQSRAHVKPRQAQRRVMSEQRAKPSRQTATQMLQVVSLLLVTLKLYCSSDLPCSVPSLCGGSYIDMCSSGSRNQEKRGAHVVSFPYP